MRKLSAQATKRIVLVATARSILFALDLLRRLAKPAALSAGSGLALAAGSAEGARLSEIDRGGSTQVAPFNERVGAVRATMRERAISPTDIESDRGIRVASWWDFNKWGNSTAVGGVRG